MNYIKLLNQFWQLRRSKRITNLQADLYYFLLQESNLREWENPFMCSNGLICTSIGITEKSLIDARNVLQQLGLIEFEKGITKQKSPVYYLPEYCNKVSNPVSKLGGKQGGNEVSNPGGNEGGNEVYINTINQTKPNETINTINISFEIFWDLYEKKVGSHAKIEKKWNALTDEERQKAIDHILEYKKSRPDKNFRKDPSTYLNNKSFNDEIIYYQPKTETNGKHQTSIVKAIPVGGRSKL